MFKTIVLKSRTKSARSRSLKLALLTASLFGASTSAFAKAGEELVVTGKRVSEASVAIGTDSPTATVSITREALLSAPAGITGLKMLESLPGFNVQANDALGMYEFGNSVSVRAFNFQQIGFLLDTIPMGRSDQFGGSPIYRYVDNENLQRVSASAGAGDVSLPSYSSLGPIVDYITSVPNEAFGGKLTQTFGSDNLRRTFARVDTGEHAGFSAYLSGSWINSDLWRGPGDIERTHYEGKARYAWDAGSLTLQGVHNDYFDYDSPSITKAQYAGTANDVFGRSGREFSYLEHIPQQPITVAGVPFSSSNYTAHYRFAVNSRTDNLVGLTLDTALAENVRVTATGYYEDKRGYGVSPEAYATSVTNYNAERLILPGLTAPRGLQYGLSTVDGTRKGGVFKAAWDLGFNELSAGVWVENDEYHRTQNRYNVENGDPEGAPLLNEVVHRQRDFISTRDTLSFFAKDTLRLIDDKLKVELGFKTLNVDYEVTGARNPADYIAGRRPTLDKTWEDNFLPQVGGVFSLTTREQIFSSYSENLALPRGADDVAAAASPAAPLPEAERSKNWEIGFRTNRPTFNAAIVAYRTTFENRLQSFAALVPGGGGVTETFFQNVGGVKASGVEFSGQWKPEFLGGRIYFNANASYNKSEFEDNFSTFTIAGNAVPDFPELVAQAGVTAEPTSWLVLNLSARHIASRYSNFTNGEETDGYTVVNAYADLGGEFSAGPLKHLKARLNVDNIFDEDYLGTITTTINTPATFRPGPPRTFQLSLSTDF